MRIHYTDNYDVIYLHTISGKIYNTNFHELLKAEAHHLTAVILQFPIIELMTHSCDTR